jgi:hypothetical protein
MLFVAVTLVSCSNPSPELAEEATAPAPISTPILIEIGETLWAEWQGEDLARLVAEYPYIFSGVVEAVRVEKRSAIPEGFPRTGPTVEGKPHVEADPTYEVSLFSVRVTRAVVADGPQVGDAVTVAVWGADSIRDDGVSVRRVMDEDNLFDVGREYLLFAIREPSRVDVFAAAPWGKFLIEKEERTLQPLVPAWSRLGAVAALENRPIEAALMAIQQALLKNSVDSAAGD